MNLPQNGVKTSPLFLFYVFCIHHENLKVILKTILENNRSLLLNVMNTRIIFLPFQLQIQRWQSDNLGRRTGSFNFTFSILFAHTTMYSSQFSDIVGVNAMNTFCLNFLIKMSLKPYQVLTSLFSIILSGNCGMTLFQRQSDEESLFDSR